MRLLAVSDLHLSHQANRALLQHLAPHPEDWLIIAGDVCERSALLDEAFAHLTARFAKVLWTPGNHELWSEDAVGGERRYAALIELARRRGVVTPEDPYPIWPGPGGPAVVVPLFLHYDYSFAPDDVGAPGAIAWARQDNIVCADERRLSCAPYSGAADWCAARLAATARRLAAELPAGVPTVLVNHYPLRRDLVYIPRIPRFVPWCGTRCTEDWHRRWHAIAAVSGHLHLRRTDWRDATRFEEVSLGYPRQWTRGRPPESYLRQILPAPVAVEQV